MPNERKYFAEVSGRLNADDAPFAVGVNEWVNAENLRSATTDAGVTGTKESIGSNVLISQPLPSVVFITIGTIEDTENARFVKFQFNTTGQDHKIICYYANINTEYVVVTSSQITGGLNFSRYSPIHSAKIVNGFLYWPDRTVNQPRKLNLEAAIKANDSSFVTNQVAYTFPLNFSEVTLIKHPPPLAPNINKITDSGFLNNFIANYGFTFAFQYVWYDNEITVTGTYSPNSRLNKTSETYNAITVSMDGDEFIPNSVRIVNLIVRYDDNEFGLPTNTAKVIKSWDKLVAADAALIADQNAQTTPLTFNFYNNITGETLSPDDVLRPFDNVPIYSESLEAARDRLFLANNIEGYDSPKETSLSSRLVTTTIDSSTVVKNVISIKQRRFIGIDPHTAGNWAYAAWYVYMTEVVPVGYYAITASETTVLDDANYPTIPAVPASVTLADLTFRGADLTTVLANTVPSGQDPRTRYDYGATAYNTTVTGLTVSTYDVFKSKSVYRYGIVFYDFAMRKCGVVTNSDLVFSIPARNFAYSVAVNGVVWTLTRGNEINEIPDWAYYYAVVRTLNQLTRFFIDSTTTTAKYATKDSSGNYLFTSDLFSTAVVGIGLNTAALNQSGLGYVYSAGDVCIIIKSDNTTYDLPVIAQIDNYIVVKAQDIGDLSSQELVYEIYTPYQTSTQEPFYEVGEMYEITNPTQDIRTYKTLSDTFLPDAYVISRNYNSVTYFAEAMCPNDTYYKRWDNDTGKVNLITLLGQARKTTYISFSDTFIPNTSVNGLSTFRALNQKNVPQDCGAINKIILTTKVQGEQGTVMLAICAGGETVSIYLGEVQITDNTGATQFFSSSGSVIGTMNILKGNKGTLNPESVSEYRGDVWFYDANNGQWIQYSVNGLDVISENKMQRFWSEWSIKYLSMTQSEIEDLGCRPFVFSIVDTKHKELLISIPKLSNTPPKGYLPDYPEVIYPFDILDYQAKTIVYKLDMPGRLPHFQGAMTFCAENFCTLQNKLYSFKNGLTWLHNQTDSSNNFYGIQYKSRIACVSNMIPNVPKVYNNQSVEANLSPSWVYMYNNYPYQQATDVLDYEIQPLEGVWYSTIKRNKLQPTATGYNTDGLLTGEKMRNVSMFVLFEFTVGVQFLELSFVQIGFDISLGHNNQLNK